MELGLIACFTILVYLWTPTECYTPFRLTDCTNHTERVVTITGEVTEDPVLIPGHVRVFSAINVHRPVTGGYRLDVTVEKFFVFAYFSLPCVSSVGSCSYDLCELLDWFRDRGCPPQVTRSNIPCMCPFANATHVLRPDPFYIPEVTGAWSWIAYGDFRVTGRLVDTLTEEEVNCYSVEFTVQDGNYWSYWDWF